MCDKSLTFQSCNQNASCGISVRFQTLSPSHRQIAHALLTRPPLIRSRSSLTVRLECVKHAASVHPEPGSNSLKKCYVNRLRELKSFFQSFNSKLLTFSTLCSKFINEILIRSFFVVVQFSRTVVFVALPSSAHVVYHILFKMSILFLKVFSIFLIFFHLF